MLCPKCASDKTRVVDTKKSGPVVERVRMCERCKFCFVTIERPELKLFDREEIEEYERYIVAEIAQEQE